MAMVRAVIVLPVIVTVLLDLDTPAGTVAENAAPSTEYVHAVMVVPIVEPVTVDVAGLVAPPAAGVVRTCEVAVKETTGALDPAAPVAPVLPVSSAGLVVDEVPLPRTTVVLVQTKVPGVRVGVEVDQPVVGATVSDELTAYSTVYVATAASAVAWAAAASENDTEATACLPGVPAP
jgi:hypothetical protein